jgi:hypothetical protein
MKVNLPRSINIKTLLIFIVILLFSITVHHYILHFQNSYSLNIGPGDTEYYTVNKKYEFGVPDRGEWVRDMRKRSFLNLPFSIRGEVVRLGFEIKSNSHPEKILISNSRKESLGSLEIPANKDFSLYWQDIETKNLPEKNLSIKISNANNPSKELDLKLNKIVIDTIQGGVDLPWFYDLYFLLSLCGFSIVLLVADFTLKQSFTGAEILGLLIILARSIDVVSYIAYLKTFLFLGLPFLIISIALIRLFCRRSILLKDEKLKIIGLIFIIGFLLHFIGNFYPYHLNKDGRLRVSFFRLMEKEGLTEFIGEMSRQHSAATGPENEGIPYPPWFNMIAYPFIKMGIEDSTWLRFQFLIISSFYTLLIYVLSRSLGLSKDTARLSSLLSIFGTGILRDIVIFVYDPKFAFTLMLLFMIHYFKNAEKMPEFTLRDRVILGMILALLLITHPDVLLSMGMFFIIVLMLTFFSRYKRKWDFIKTQAGIGLTGLVLSLVLFYGLFLWNMMTVTLPNTISAKQGLITVTAGVERQDYFIFKGLLTRTSNTIPLMLMPFFIYGLFILFKKLKKEKKKWTLLLLSSWTISYLVFLLLWSLKLLFNFLKYFPEYHLIYPVVFIVLGYAFFELYSKFRNNLFIKYSLIMIIALSIIINAIWFYCLQIGMCSNLPPFMTYLYMIF